MHRDPRAFLWDVQQAAEAIASFTTDLDFEAYLASNLVRSAVERQFEIIGEALNQLSKHDPALADQVPNIGEIVAFRNILIHNYARIDHGKVWETAQEKLRELHGVVSGLLVKLGPPGT